MKSINRVVEKCHINFEAKLKFKKYKKCLQNMFNKHLTTNTYYKLNDVIINLTNSKTVQNLKMLNGSF